MPASDGEGAVSALKSQLGELNKKKLYLYLAYYASAFTVTSEYFL